MNAHVNESLWPQAAPTTTQNLMGAAKFILSLSLWFAKKLKLKGARKVRAELKGGPTEEEANQQMQK